MTTDQTEHRTDPVQAVAEAHPNYSTGSREGALCMGCNAPITAPDGSYTMGWNLHLIEAAVAAAEPQLSREAKAAALQEFRRLVVRAYPKGLCATATVIADLNERIEREGQS